MTNRHKLNGYLDHLSSLLLNKHFIVVLFLIMLIFVFIFYKFQYYGYLIFFVCISCGIILYYMATFRIFKPSEIFHINNLQERLCLILFIIAYSSSIGYLYLFSSLYTKPLLYYLLLCACFAFIFLLSFSTGKHVKSLVAILIVLLGLNIYLSNFIVFPHGIYCSNDAHYMIYNYIIPIIEYGRIPIGSMDPTYAYFPLHQIFVSCISLISSMNPEFLYLLLPGILFAFSTIFVFHLGNKFFNITFATISGLTYLLTPEIYTTVIHPYQFSYALVISLFVLYCAITLLLEAYKQNYIQIVNNNSFIFIIIYIIGFITLVLTHHHTTVFIFLFLIILYIILNLMKPEYFHKPYTILILLSSIIFIGYWLYTSIMINKVVEMLNIYNFLFTGVSYSSAITAETINNTIQSSNFQIYFQTLLNYIGVGILFLFATIGILYGIYKKNILAYTWSIFAMIIWALISLGSFISLPLLLSNRLYSIFWATSMIYLCAIGVDYLIKKFGKKMIYCMSLLFFILTIMCLGSVLTGAETSIFNDGGIVIKYYDTNAEIQSLSWMTEKIPINTEIYMSESWLPNYIDKNHVYLDFDMVNNQIDITSLKPNQYLVLKNRYFEDGIRIRTLSEAEQIEQTKSGNLTLSEASNQRYQMMKLNTSIPTNLNNNKNNIYNNTLVNIYN